MAHIEQKNRYKKHLISAMARNITVTSAPGQLNHEDLKAEFDRIDKDKGGTISKDELWKYITSGHMGTTSEKDFNAMWSVIDLDDSGEVDFVVCMVLLNLFDLFSSQKRAHTFLTYMSNRSLSLFSANVEISLKRFTMSNYKGAG